MKKFETLKAGLGNGLIVSLTEQGHAECDFYHEDYDLFKSYKLVNIDFEHDAIYTIQSLDKGESYDDLDGEFIKPHLFPLSHLAKPIRVEGYNNGEEFVPMELIITVAEDEKSNESLEFMAKHNPLSLPYDMVADLIKCKFNVFDIPPSDYIDASESKVYEPK